MYLTREDWIHHMKSEHTVKQWLCQYCPDKDKGRALVTYSTADDLKSHLRNSHPSASQSVLPLHLLVDNSVRHVLPKVHCPLCPGEETVYELDTTSHVAGHLHSFSLTALPWEDEIPETGSSSHNLGGAQRITPGHNLTDEEPYDVQIGEAECKEADVESGDSVPLWLEPDMMFLSGRSQSAEVVPQSSAANEDLDEVVPPRWLVENANPGINTSSTDVLDQDDILIEEDILAEEDILGEEKLRSEPRSDGSQEIVVEEPLLYPHQETVRTVDEETSERGRSRTRSSKPRSRKSQFGKAVLEQTAPSTDMKGGVFDSISSYLLRKQVLMSYLQQLFPNYAIVVHPDDRTRVRSTYSI